MTNKTPQTRAPISSKLCFRGIQSSSALQRKRPYSSCPQLRPRCSSSAVSSSLLCPGVSSFCPLLPAPFPGSEGECWLLNRAQDTNNSKQHLLFKSPRKAWKKGWLGPITVSAYHIACTDTGLNMCTLLSVDTLNPLWRKEAQ